MKTSLLALILDLDGTLADSLADIGNAMNCLLVSYGFSPLPLAIYREYLGNGASHLVRRAFLTALERDGKYADAQAFPASLPALLAAYRAAYAARQHMASKPYPGIATMLDGLVARELPIAVFSNKHDDFTQHLVQQQFARWPFSSIRGERKGVPRKPDPTAAFELAIALNVLPKRIGFVGDTPVDMQTASNAGMVPIGVLWGFRSRNELQEAGAQYLLDRPHDLLQLIDSFTPSP